jgi:hypothetical protein
MDGQTEDELMRFCQSHKLPWDDSKSAVILGRCMLLNYDEGRRRIKENLRTAIEELIDQLPT